VPDLLGQIRKPSGRLVASVVLDQLAYLVHHYHTLQHVRQPKQPLPGQLRIPVLARDLGGDQHPMAPRTATDKVATQFRPLATRLAPTIYYARIG
jgi:hypothetical protein